MTDTEWTRETIHAELRTILAETRGCEESACTLDATLFGDIDFESIDFLEVSFRIEEPFGFPYPTDDIGEIMNLVGENSTTEDVREALGKLERGFFITAPKDLPGVEPFDAVVLSEAVRNLFTVGHLVTFVERRLAASAA